MMLIGRSALVILHLQYLCFPRLGTIPPSHISRSFNFKVLIDLFDVLVWYKAITPLTSPKCAPSPFS